MDRNSINRRPAALRGLAFAAALMLPAAASGPAFADAGSLGARDEFAATFAPLNAASAAFVPSAGMVDVTAIDPVDEPAAPEAGAGQFDGGQAIGGGMASYYGNELAGHRTANGERFNPGELTAAHRTLPFGSRVRVTYAGTGKSVVVRINDRGPFARGRIIDLSKSAAARIGLVARGSGRVELALID